MIFTIFICSQVFTTTCKHVKVMKNVHSFSEQTLNWHNFVHTDQNNDPFFSQKDNTKT